MRSLVLLGPAVAVALGCGPTYWRGPVERTAEPARDEQLGRDATMVATVAWGIPDPDRPRPAWLGPPGEAWSEAAQKHGRARFHNGRLRAVERVKIALDPDGGFELAGCPRVDAIGRTAAQLAIEIQHCAAQFVDEPKVSIEIDRNAAWSFTLVDGARTRVIRLSGGITFMQVIASTPRPELGRHRRVSLQLPGQPPRRIDLAAILELRAPDFPLRPGDTVRIE